MKKFATLKFLLHLNEHTTAEGKTFRHPETLSCFRVPHEKFEGSILLASFAAAPRSVDARRVKYEPREERRMKLISGRQRKRSLVIELAESRLRAGECGGAR